MKRNGWLALLSSLVLICIISFLCSQYLVPLVDTNKTKPVYSETSCMTSQITNEMNIYDIAKLYRDSNATVQFRGEFTDRYSNSSYASLGSGVVIASTGYKTSNVTPQVTASQGSYIATNYHVVDFLNDSSYIKTSLKVRAEDEIEYSCQVLWGDKNLDLAIVYAEVSYNYIKMVDRWVDCSSQDKLDYEPAFAIGSPLEEQNLNRLSTGNIASNNEILMFTGQTIYVSTNAGQVSYTTVKASTSQQEVAVLDNVYEDVIDISVGISGGSSGGGLFDGQGNLIGLVALGTSAEFTGGNQINGAVAIYPVMQVIDKIIANNETSANYKVYSLSTFGFTGLDSYEAAYASAYKEAEEVSYYFLNGKLYTAGSMSIFSSPFDFEDDGYKILTNSTTYSALNAISAGSVITKVKTADGQDHTIKDRNDLLYVIIGLNQGESITFTYEQGLLTTNTYTVTVTV